MRGLRAHWLGIFAAAFVVAQLLVTPAEASDWHQWRGPGRDGVAASSPPLTDALAEDLPPRLWRSERIMAENQGGYGSVSVAEGRAYAYANWKYKVPIEARTLTLKGLEGLGWSPDMPEELLGKVEAARASEERTALDRAQVRSWSVEWVKQNVPEEHGKWRQLCQKRLLLGKDAVPLPVLSGLEAIVDKEFPTQEALDEWFDKNNIEERWQGQIRRVVPTTEDRAYDKVFCLDAVTGETVWQQEYPGAYSGYPCSSTPCIANGRCYVQGSGGRVYCLDAATGEEVWQGQVQVKAGELASSFVVQDGVAVLLVGQLTGFDAATGEVLWRQGDVSGVYSSPAYWRTGDGTYLVCNGGREVFCLDAKAGAIVWRAPGGGWSTPAVSGDLMVVSTNNKALGVIGYRLSLSGAEKLWSVEFLDRGTSPLIYGEHVYLVGGGGEARILCVDASSGEVVWQEKLPNTEIASPIVADGKLFYVARGSLYMVEASPAGCKSLGEAKVGAATCITPGVVDGRLFLRLKDSVACYDLRKSPS